MTEPSEPCRPRPSRARRRGPRRRPAQTVIAGVVVRHGARYTFRRAVAVVVVVVVLVVSWFAVAALGRALGTPAPAGAGPVAAEVAAPATVEIVVAPGDTVWALAARVAGPGVDPRPVVDAIVDHLGGPMLTAGERIELPASLVP